MFSHDLRVKSYPTKKQYVLKDVGKKWRKLIEEGIQTNNQTDNQIARKYGRTKNNPLKWTGYLEPDNQFQTDIFFSDIRYPTRSLAR